MYAVAGCYNIHQKQVGQFVSCQLEHTTHLPESNVGSCLQWNGRIVGGTYVSVVAIGYSIACKLGFITEHCMFYKPLVLYKTLSETAWAVSFLGWRACTCWKWYGCRPSSCEVCNTCIYSMCILQAFWQILSLCLHSTLCHTDIPWCMHFQMYMIFKK